MGEQEIAAFLSHLAVQGGVAASTQNQAFSALLFLYRHVLDQSLITSLVSNASAARPSSPSFLPARSHGA